MEHTFDFLCRFSATSVSRRDLLRTIVSAVGIAFLARPAYAASCNQFTGISAAYVEDEILCGPSGLNPPVLCTHAAVVALDSVAGFSCPPACPMAVSITQCNCTGKGRAVVTGRVTCSCGNAISPASCQTTCCDLGFICCDNQCVKIDCLHCGQNCKACGKGQCCLSYGGLCSSSQGACNCAPGSACIQC